MSFKRNKQFRLGAGVVILVFLGGLVWGGARLAAGLRDPVGPAPATGWEGLRAEADYETSQNCRVCHGERTKSWARTFHRTMTQTAGDGSIVAPFDGRELNWLGVRSVPRREGEKFIIETAHPRTGERVALEVVRTVGSRRMQQYITRVGDRYLRLPVAWSIEEQRWFHLSEAFFHPDGEDFHQNTTIWDANCIFCHNVKAQPGWDPAGRAPAAVAAFYDSEIVGTVDSRVEELGISCEACHGPGGEHARRMRSPLRRAAFNRGTAADPSIVHPARLDKQRSVMICAHCHGQRMPAHFEELEGIMRHGDPYTAGEDLSRYYMPVDRDLVMNGFAFAPRFWADGSPRLTAYEYQGLLRTDCYLKGEMSCLSCHSMHDGDPHGQMRPDLPGDRICTQCHEGFEGAKLAEHTRHDPAGAGSRCIACHMPPVVYGVMSWHPTHEIKSPDPAASARFGKPDACTICHTGRSIQWADRWTREWWPDAANAKSASAGVSDALADSTAPGSSAALGNPAPLGDAFAMAEIPRALLGGDVVYRALAAERLGEASPDGEMRAAAIRLLAHALLDPYPNVRRIARSSLVRLTGDESIPMALDPADARVAALDRLKALAERDAVGAVADSNEPTTNDLARLFPEPGILDPRVLLALTRDRQEVPVPIGE